MKKQLFLIGISILAINSSAANLSQRAREEAGWTPVTLRLADSPDKSAGEGFLTPSGQWKIESLNPSIEMVAPLISEDASSRGLERFTRNCGRMGYGFASARERGLKHKLILRLPNWSQAPKGDLLIRGESSQTIVAAQIQSQIEFDSRSYTMLYSNYDPRKIEISIESQLQSKISQLRSKGMVEIDISGHDYLACDYVMGLAKIGLKVSWVFPAAKLKRQTVVATADLTRAHQIALSNMEAGTTCEENRIIASALLTSSLESVTGKKISSLGLSNFSRMFSQIFEAKQCQMLPRQSVDFTLLSQEFDILSEQNRQDNTVVYTRFNGELR